MTSPSAILTAVLLHFIWQGAVIGLVAIGTLAGLRPSRASTRYGILCVAFAALIAAPVVTLVTLRVAPSLATESLLALVTPPKLSAPNVADALQRFALPLWIAGVALFAIRLFAAYRHVSALQTGAHAAADHVFAVVRGIEQRMQVRRRVAVVVTAVAEAPSLVGWLKPVVLIPTSLLTGLSSAQLEAILAHEIAHVRRHDYLVNVLQMLAETLLFYHPVTWWLSARMREERELCCDDMVIDACGNRVVYARALAEAERMRLLGRLTPAAALGATDGQLVRRIRRLLAGESSSQRLSSVVPALVVCVLAACAGSAVDAPREPSLTARAEIRDHEPATFARTDGGRGTPNPNENGDASFEATLERSRRNGWEGRLTLERDAVTSSYRRLVSIQLSGVPREIRDRMQLPVQLGDTITVWTMQAVDSRLRMVDSTLSATVAPLARDAAALLITSRGNRLGVAKRRE